MGKVEIIIILQKNRISEKKENVSKSKKMKVEKWRKFSRFL